jgi:hypothetical protein
MTQAQRVEYVDPFAPFYTMKSIGAMAVVIFLGHFGYRLIQKWKKA